MGRRTIVITVAVLTLVAAAFAGGWVAGRTGIGAAVPVAALDARERAFADGMQHVVLDGVFTVDGAPGAPRPDRYEITSVEKVGGELWRFSARLVHDSTDVTLPIVVPMKWVDDTPVVMLTDYRIPTLGTFSARVFFYRDRYAGTWWHGNEIGGHLYGRITR
jgi:hypothetical protein